MKKVVKLILIVIMIMPIMIFASTYEESETISKNYLKINDYSTFDRYIFIESDKSEKPNLPNYDLFRITLLSDKNKSTALSYSYLFDGTVFWTSTLKSDKQHYVISKIKDESFSDTEKLPSTKVVVGVKPETLVTGTGKIGNPWIFVDKNKVTLTTNDKQKGTLSTKPCSNGGEPLESTSFIYGSGDEIYLCAKSGYKYISNSCTDALEYNKNNKSLSIRYIQRDIKCKVIFGIDTVEINFENPEYTKKSEPNILYLAYSKGWYLDEAGTKQTKKLISIPKKDGYVFRGYYKNKSNIDEVLNTENQIIDKDGKINDGFEEISKTKISIYSNWKENVLNISYNVNGGTLAGTNGFSTVDSLVYKDGTLLNQTLKYSQYLSSDGLYDWNNSGWINITKTGHHAKSSAEWCNTSDGKGTCYSDSVAYSAPELCDKIKTSDCKITYYINWNKNVYTIKYNANYGTGAMSNQTVTYGDGSKTKTSGFTREGYTFAGWTGSDGKNYTTLEAIDKLNIAHGSTFTLTAKWTANTYSIAYNGNGSTSGSMANTSHTYDVNAALRTIAYAKTGYTFAGWAETSTGPVKYANGATVKNLATSGTKTLYAKWTINKIYVSFNMNGGTWGGSTNTHLGYSGNNITYDGTKYIVGYDYGQTGIDLVNPDNNTFINIKKTSFIPKAGGEWKKSDGTALSDSGGVSASSLCNASNGNCSVELFVNWINDKVTYSTLSAKCNNTSKGNAPYLIEYAGECEILNDGNDNWRIKLKGQSSSAPYGTVNLKFTVPLKLDVFVVGGGGGGYNDYNPGGGAGGFTKTLTNVSVSATTYPTTIGAGGAPYYSGGQTSALGAVANGGGPGSNPWGGTGGSGGGSGGPRDISGCGGILGNAGGGYGGAGQYTTTCEFGEGTTSACNRGNAFAYASGGTGGYCYLNGDIYAGSYGIGGGASCAGGYCTPGASNTGGGGGGWYLRATSGGSGIIVIRNAR